MITAIDSNILIDIFLEDKTFAKASKKALLENLEQGAVVACGVVLIETMTHFPSAEIFFESLSILGIQPQEIPMPAFLQAALAWQTYKRSGGKKGRGVADFLIGGHALMECDQLLTRDRGFFREYFKKLKIVEPRLHK